MGWEQRFEAPDNFIARRRLRSELQLVAMLVPIEKAVARRAEPLPDRLRLRLADGADRLPFGLQPLDLAGCGIPVGRIGQRLGLSAERLLLRQVGRPVVLAAPEILLPAREEPIARSTEPLPDRFFVAARDGPDRSPLRLERLNLGCRSNPV